MRNTGLNNSFDCSGEQIKDKENKLIIRALLATDRPLTRRELSERTGLEATLCRALFNMLHKQQSISIAKYDYCKATNKLVMHFSLKREGKNGN